MHIKNLVAAFGLVASVCHAVAPPSAHVDVNTSEFRGRFYEASAELRRSVGIVVIGGSEGQLLLAENVAP